MKIKRKGAYCWKNIHHDPKNPEVLWHQNQSAPVIAMAAERHLVYGEDIEDVIRNHEDHLDFMFRTKVPRSSKLVIVDESNEFEQETQLQNICRYYISEEGGYLVKLMPPLVEYKMTKFYEDENGNKVAVDKPADLKRYEKKGYKYLGEENVAQPDRRMGVNVGCKVTPCNDINNFKGGIDYQHYINEAMKLVCFSDVDELEDSDE